MEGNILVHLFLNGTVLSNLVKHDQQRFNKRLIGWDFSNLKLSKIKRLASIDQRGLINGMKPIVLSHRATKRSSFVPTRVNCLNGKFITCCDARNQEASCE